MVLSLIDFEKKRRTLGEAVARDDLVDAIVSAGNIIHGNLREGDYALFRPTSSPEGLRVRVPHRISRYEFNPHATVAYVRRLLAGLIRPQLLTGRTLRNRSVVTVACNAGRHDGSNQSIDLNRIEALPPRGIVRKETIDALRMLGEEQNTPDIDCISHVMWRHAGSENDRVIAELIDGSRKPMRLIEIPDLAQTTPLSEIVENVLVEMRASGIYQTVTRAAQAGMLK